MRGFLPVKVWVLKHRGKIKFVTTKKFIAKEVLAENPTWVMEDYKLNEIISSTKGGKEK